MLTVTTAQPKTATFLTASWRNLAMLNFVIDPAILQPFVPAGTELDFWQGRTYVSVVGFQFLDTRVLGIPVPLHSRFEEVNLRFYVVRHAPDGPRRGVVFLREIVPKMLVSVGARWFYNEPYVTMPMQHRVELPKPLTPNPSPMRRGEDGVVEYQWRHDGRWNGLSVRFTGSSQPLIPGSEEEFITEHYFGYTRQRDGSTIEYAVEHPPWRVWPTLSAEYDCDVAAIYGEAFVPVLREPTSVLVADGSPVVVRRGVRL